MTGAGGGGFGLEEIGIPGRDYLREALTSCTDPLKAIEDFQVENGILLPSLRPMLPLLDLHGIKRIDLTFYQYTHYFFLRNQYFSSILFHSSTFIVIVISVLLTLVPFSFLTSFISFTSPLSAFLPFLPKMLVQFLFYTISQDLLLC